MEDDSDESSSIVKSVNSQLSDAESPVGWYEVIDTSGVVVRSDVSLRSMWVTRLPCGAKVYIYGQRGHRVWIQKPVEGWTTIRLHSGHRTLQFISALDPNGVHRKDSIFTRRFSSIVNNTNRNTLINASQDWSLSDNSNTGVIHRKRLSLEELTYGSTSSDTKSTLIKSSSVPSLQDNDRVSVKIATLPEVQSVYSFEKGKHVDERWRRELYKSGKERKDSIDGSHEKSKNSPFAFKIDDSDTVVFDRNAIPCIAPTINFGAGKFGKCNQGETLWERRLKVGKILFENCEDGNAELSLADSVESVVSFSEHSYCVDDKWIKFHEREIPAQEEDKIIKIECAYMGDNSTIYRVEEPDSGAIKALKAIDISSRVMRQQIDTEISLLTNLQHGCLVELFDVTWQPAAQTICLLLEWCDGGSLYDFIKCTGPMELKRIYQISRCILSGLTFLHEKEILHNDIKPSNILLHQKSAKLSDFGISKPEHSTKTLLEHSGTHIYCAPERLLGEPYNHTSDIWSFGLVLWAMVEGKSYFLPETSIPKILSIIMTAGNIKMKKKYPKAFRKLFRYCCNTDPLQRKDAEELLKLKVFKKRKTKCVVM